MYEILLAFVTAFALTFFAIPSIISIARKKQFVDEPGERKAHDVSTPSLGGIGIFAGTLFSIVLWTPLTFFGELQYILSAFIIIFFIGAKDDIDPIEPWKKLVGEFIAAGILIYFSDIRITSFYGIFGISEVPLFLSVIVTLLTIVLIINAFNLIDGIDGLAGSVGALVSITFGTWFFLVDRADMAAISFALAGSVIAFLYYNITPAKIFMGDTGSLIIGLATSILAINFIEHHQVLLDSKYAFRAPPGVAIGILIIPLFDTLRVFAMRMIRGKSPFQPDKNHIHHLLLSSGLTHMQSTMILIGVNLFFILLVLYLPDMRTIFLLIFLLIIASFLTLILYLVLHLKSQKRYKAL
ncbi:MAG: undecaprenyl/decaprenyl-phosphate alpha-N-acetylglucosaminyl 1-phosphate transferase [Saprospiraceae bacterium]|nr:undecaprenyl/decaprenyl-phosphate alpha-N-acetylglucosaminyl 1-phosphate transferase [Bacteroidia bacterium]MBT8230780.1 undecaprenyl/decaprenyl-phosphate alpha-N-acetylglucosaminyl 1-phosphate transferase [Bacteroidia bacterium]NNF22738.1 undecaprenyl/decaprenyl-phosphate alpha-N-acetylglucosaminyl 1-phosphate transferase [Saprospiraceae bacterium]